MPQWNGQWPGGRTYLDRHGNTRWQLERMHNGVRYSRRLEARNESEALAELALFDRVKWTPFFGPPPSLHGQPTST